MRIGPDVLECPASGERVEITHRPGEQGEHAEIMVTLGGVGSGPGLHLHPEQIEHFRVVRGSVQVLVGEETVLVEAGEDVTVPPSTAHSYRALEPGTQLLIRVTPGHGFESALEDVYELFDDGSIEAGVIHDMDAFQACFDRHKNVMISLRNGPAPADSPDQH
jgi:mannose-6-phosphate isomerase-like protein (cupin superfamily)